jgi:hypothetical protein
VTTNPRTKIQPVFVEVSLRNAIARRLREHGVPEFDNIADEVTLELTGKHVVSVRLHWPQGLDTRVPTAAECEPFNRALTGVSNDRMSMEDNVRVLRTCYQALWHRVRIHANERAEQMASVPEPTAPVVTTSMLKGTNPVLEATIVVKPKRKSTRKKVEPLVPSDTLTSLQEDLTNLRKTLEGAEG